jgi:hypothetical protein
MQYVIGDLLEVEKGIIAHQVNIYGIMGGGVALYLAKRYPNLEQDYQSFCAAMSPQVPYKNRDFSDYLGHVFFWNDGILSYNKCDLIVANCFSQGGESKSSHTSYDAIVSCFDKIEAFRKKHDISPDKSTYVPFGYGCGIADGNWNIVRTILAQYTNIVIVCRIPDLVKYYGNPDQVFEMVKGMEVLQ